MVESESVSVERILQYVVLPQEVNAMANHLSSSFHAMIM